MFQSEQTEPGTSIWTDPQRLSQTSASNKGVEGGTPYKGPFTLSPIHKPYLYLRV